MLFRFLALAGIACLSFTGAFASAYVGAAAGQGATEIDTGSGSPTFDANDLSFKVLGGYRVMKFFGVEGDYRDMGTQSDNVGGTDMDVATTAIDLFAVGVIPVGTAFEVFGKAGYSMWDADFDISGIGSGSDDGNDLAYGIGAAYTFGKFALRMEYEQFDIDNTDNVSMASIGADFRF
jgi:hypothetical protein